MKQLPELITTYTQLPAGTEKQLHWAELLRWLERLSDSEFIDEVSDITPPVDPLDANRIAAWVAVACRNRQVDVPDWTWTVKPLEVPWFPTKHPLLRLELMIDAPLECRRRKVFDLHGYGDAV